MNDKKALKYAIDVYLYARIAKLERLLADAARFIAYAQSKGVHGGEAIAKEIEENLNQEETCKI